MSSSAAITEYFGGEERKFLCRMGELRKIQERCNAGPPEIIRRLAHCAAIRQANPKATILELAAIGLGDWRIEDVRETVLVCLVAGGENPNVAGKLVREWIDDRGFQGLLENVELALVCLVAGAEPPEGAGEPQPGEPPETESSTSGPSTATPPKPSDSAPKT